MRFSQFFNLEKTQAELDFVDVNSRADTRLFVDPYAIEIRADELSAELAHHIVTFFEDVLQSLRGGDDARALELTSNLTEPQETFLGMSKDRPRGRGMGPFDAGKLIEAFRNSGAFQTGLLRDVAEAELFIEGIGPDKISDLTTNLIRGPLIAYTREQCELWGIPLAENVPVAPFWDPDERRWKSEFHSVPLLDGVPVVLVPKVVVRRRLSLDSQEYYNSVIVKHLQAEHLNVNSGLVKIFRSKKRRGERYVTKKSVKEEHPFSKELLAQISRDSPRLLEFYKSLKGAEGALSPRAMDEELQESEFCAFLIDRLRGIQEGTEQANSYQDAAAGILTYLFYPDLVTPKLEQRIHEGRKRIDLVFTNWSGGGFFQSLKESPQTRARYIIVECKNYDDDIGNPELDQLTGRFSPARGRFGMITCRRKVNKAAVLRRCRDAVADDRGTVLVLDDDDLVRLLELVAAGKRNEVAVVLEAMHRDLVM